VESPFRSEAAAFRFLLVTIGAFALIVVTSWISALLGFVTFLALSAAAVWMYVGQRRRESPGNADHTGEPAAARILVVADETLGSDELMSAISTLALTQPARFLVVCPAVDTRRKTSTSAEDAARAEARKRLDATLARLASVGVEAHGELGDSDPLQAIDDAVRTFQPDEIVISTHPPGRSSWLEGGVVDAASARFDVPVTHVVADVDARSRG